MYPCNLHLPEPRLVQALGPPFYKLKKLSPWQGWVQGHILREKPDLSSWLHEFLNPALPGQGSFWTALCTSGWLCDLGGGGGLSSLQISAFWSVNRGDDWLNSVNGQIHEAALMCYTYQALLGARSPSNTAPSVHEIS